MFAMDSSVWVGFSLAHCFRYFTMFAAGAEVKMGRYVCVYAIMLL